MFGPQFGLQGVVGTDQTIVLPVVDAKTNGMAIATIGPRDHRSSVRWFVRIPKLEDAEKFPCPMGFDRKTIRFDPVLLYVDHPVPPRVSVSLQRVLCGPEQGRIDKKVTIENWKPTQETFDHPALTFSILSCSPGQTLEFLGTSWWRRGPSKLRRDPWEPIEGGPPVASFHVVSVWCLLKMTWLPSEGGRTKYRFVDGKSTQKPPTPIDPISPMPTSPAPLPKPVEAPDPTPSNDG